MLFCEVHEIAVILTNENLKNTYHGLCYTSRGALAIFNDRLDIRMRALTPLSEAYKNYFVYSRSSFK